jgi:Flp pilus assembly protein TadG
MVITRLAGLGRDRRGTSAIEFALVAPLFAFLMAGITDLAMGLSRKYQLEQASYRALELVTVGTLQSDYSYIEPEVMSAAEVPADNVEVEAWLECNSAEQDFSTTCAEDEQTERFLQVTVTDNYQPIFAFGPLGEALSANADGSIPLTARSTIRVQ